MILDSLSHSHIYEKLSPRIARGFQYLHSYSLSTARFLLDEENVYALNQSYSTVSASEKKFESHRKYLDIHYVLDGEELIQFANIDQLTVEVPYVAKDDCALYQSPASCTSIILKPGLFALFYPNDGHKPGCSISGSSNVKKVVVKVKV